MSESIPLSRPLIGEPEERRVLEVLRSGQLSLGPVLARFEHDFAAAVNARCASAVSSGTAGLHLALRAVGVGAGEEVITTPFSFVASANVALYERARPVFADIDPGHPQPRSRGRRGGGLGAHGGAAAGARVRLSGRHPRAGAPGPADRRGRLRGPGGALPGWRSVGAGPHPAVFGFYPNKQLTTGEGGMVTTPDPELKERIDSERNQGRAPDLDWLDHDRLGFNYRLSDVACALGVAQLEHLDDRLAGRARVAALYREALADLEGLELPCPDHGGARRGWFVFVVQLPRSSDREAVVRELREQGVASKPYFPAIHLMSFYRETFGHREGQFPVCEDVAARSIALPFFPQMSESQVEQVARALRHALGQ